MTCGSYQKWAEDWIQDHYEDLPAEMQVKADTAWIRTCLEAEWALEIQGAVEDRWREFCARVKVPAQTGLAT